MKRYFIEVFYKGAGYAGFQVQQNANSIQAEIEKALRVFFKQSFSLTGSSRTDAGVNALSNYFHFDTDALASFTPETLIRSVYNLNAILPAGIGISNIFQVDTHLHCRFSAISRQYKYYIYPHKNPFLLDRAYFYPYKLDLNLLNAAASVLPFFKDFTSFSKRNTQVSSFICDIVESEWQEDGDCIVYSVTANRFLRGMVRGLVGTMLKVGTGKLSLMDFNKLIVNRDCTKADFAVPPQGLFLVKVNYPSLV